MTTVNEGLATGGGGGVTGLVRVPAEAGTQFVRRSWAPAFAGVREGA